MLNKFFSNFGLVYLLIGFDVSKQLFDSFGKTVQLGVNTLDFRYYFCYPEWRDGYYSNAGLVR